MKKIILLILSIIIPIVANAQMTEKVKSSFCKSIEQNLKLSKYIQQIKSGKIPAYKISIIYTVLKNTQELCIHQQNGAVDNKVYILKDGHQEGVYNKNGNLVKDGINDGSYNYFNPRTEPLLHFNFDISPWIMWGASRTDTTTIKSRIYAYMGDLEGGIRRTLKQKSKPGIPKKLTLGHLQALAVFIKAIEKGKANSFFSLFEKVKKVNDKQLIEILTRLNKGFEKVYKNSKK